MAMCSSSFGLETRRLHIEGSKKALVQEIRESLFRFHFDEMCRHGVHHVAISIFGAKGRRHGEIAQISRNGSSGVRLRGSYAHVRVVVAAGSDQRVILAMEDGIKAC